ncbi:hypothetical protein Z517_11204 [Fonsecaea pedrosoi CBS 271.37]|uniref:Unplaced genomic scaffold supercont1.7, whole genome shotgun sequence n=1 Tax=Fonsecaea pedrosoi CBS 271.37 TaxID=1442368 RepID=A0A0D2G747_9EURO|nr:uncharacterized protein Z517_11204 [Fonsecaea pedrosoi CBS 271.37]KIW76458.1 hypothetical protein Z517_11204 [Fonsecaea pedrosoi CBS 271.37]
MPKDLRGAGLLPTFAEGDSLTHANRESYQRMRRAISHAFSEKALREQEEIIQSYVDLLMSKLDDICQREPQDLVKWFNWTTFDIMGDLAFDEPFHDLAAGGYHEWVTLIFNGVKVYPWWQAVVYYKLLRLSRWLVPQKDAQAKKDADALAYQKVEQRVARTNIDRKDFLWYILRHNDPKLGLTMPGIQENAVVGIIAGSETTATFLSGLVYLLLRNPKVYKRLEDEVRMSYKSYDDITMIKSQSLVYHDAVIHEVFRIYPPAPATMPRIVPGKGENILGQWVPGDTTVGVAPYATSHDPRNFFRPEDFLPERWLCADKHADGDVAADKFSGDDRAATQPFSFGPRNCIGMNMAYSEIRLIVCKLLWRFDLKLAACHQGGNWLDQEMYTLWEKPSLMVELVPACGSE